MFNYIKSCIIIYGYTDNCLNNLDSPVLLIEPRKDYIDKIKSLSKIKLNNVTLICKALDNQTTLSESILCYNKDDYLYWIENDIYTNYFNISKQRVYITSINNLINTYKIQNIQSLVININIKNCNDILHNLESFNHIISNIKINNNVRNFSLESKIISNFYIQEDKINEHTNLLKECTLHHDLSTLQREVIQEEVFTNLSHKNLNIKLPNIAIYFSNTEDCKKNIESLSLFMQQYHMNLILENNTNGVIITYPESISLLNNLDTNKKQYSKIFHENIVHNLEIIFNKNENDIVSNLDIIIQFVPKYLSSNNTLQIMYPLKDNVLYINKVFDIIYATKNCMYMLYQILKSKYFTDYISEKQSDKKNLFKIFSKKFFYEYISKIFIIKEF